MLQVALRLFLDEFKARLPCRLGVNAGAGYPRKLCIVILFEIINRYRLTNIAADWNVLFHQTDVFLCYRGGGIKFFHLCASLLYLEN